MSFTRPRSSLTYLTVSATVLCIFQFPAIKGVLICLGNAATPGSVRPPRNSSDAPPPVEMCVIRSATPAFFTAAIESPPPTIVVPFTLATACAIAIVPFANASISKTPIGSVPHHRARIVQRIGVRLRGARADVEPHAIADLRIVHAERLGRRARLELRRNDVIDGKQQRQPARLRALENVARGALLVVLDERLADRLALRFQERVRHGAADQQAIDARDQVLDHLDLVRHLGAAEDGDIRPRGIAHRLAEVAKLAFHQQPGAAPPEESERSRRRMRARDAPRRRRR